ncbi:hypothetical protein I2I11_12765 [Pontibacter sp. 172403-2]|uniref:hypothetical protein n=1 Tax=Pontibacter rufus TaxID=2791028 RepID=UPI0018AF739F|nr:hypothetical protein [Pontibacter sp. 172403-2]MBF9254169.1 hypothetical protein [Pontibacter sp. 172403-2]
MKTQTIIYTLLLLVLSLGCRQVSDLKAFTEATYSLSEVHDVKLDGIDVMQKRSPNDFTTQEGDSLLASISDNTLKASTTLYLHVQLPAPDEASSMTVTRLEWQLLVDGEETLTGTINQPMILHEGLNKLPVNTSVLMAEQEGIRNYEGLSKLMTLLAKKQNLRRNLTLQIKPTIKTPVGDVEAPGYITVGQPAQS